MIGLLAVVAFALGFVFHGSGFAGNAWFGWQGITLLGFVLLAIHLVFPTVWAAPSVWTRRPGA